MYTYVPMFLPMYTYVLTQSAHILAQMSWGDWSMSLSKLTLKLWIVSKSSIDPKYLELLSGVKSLILKMTGFIICTVSDHEREREQLIIRQPDIALSSYRCRSHQTSRGTTLPKKSLKRQKDFKDIKDKNLRERERGRDGRKEKEEQTH